MRLLLVFALGCGSHPPAPTTGGAAPPHTATIDAAVPVALPLDQDLDRLATRGLALLEDVARVLVGVEDDCQAATVRLGELETRYADVIAANAKVLHDNREMELKLALRRFDDRFQTAAKTIMEAKTLKACWQDPDFTKAIDQLAGKSDGSP